MIHYLTEVHYDYIVTTARRTLKGYLNQYHEDIAHSCIVSLLEKPGCFSGNEIQFKAFVKKTIYYRISDYTDKVKRRKDKGFVSMPDHYTPQTVSENLTPLEKLVHAEERQLLRRALLELKKNERQLILLRTHFGCSSRQIAQRLKMKEQHVPVYYKRALQKLRMIMESHDIEKEAFSFLFPH